MKSVLTSIIGRITKWGLLLTVLGLAGCVTPSNKKTASGPSPRDTLIVRESQPKEFPPTSQRIFATPRRPAPKPEPKPAPKSEEVLIVEPPVAPPPEIKPADAKYTVRKGDCLSWIAKKFKISLGDLLAANALDRNAKLYVGQKLILPGVTPEQVNTMNGAPSEYIVQKGDCLSLIAHKYGVSVRELRAANNLKNDRIIARKKLIIPERGRYAGQKENNGPKGTKKEKNFEVNADGYYTIRKGDSLSIIASKTKISVRDLQNWNNISDPTKIKIGEKILVKNKAITSEDMIKKEPTISTLPESQLMRDTDFFGAIDEIPVVHVQD